MWYLEVNYFPANSNDVPRIDPEGPRQRLIARLMLEIAALRRINDFIDRQRTQDLKAICVAAR